jgi:hypothetical protein
MSQRPSYAPSEWQARIDEQRRLKMAKTQEHDSHVRIGWEVQELSSFFAFSIYMLLEQAWPTTITPGF